VAYKQQATGGEKATSNLQWKATIYQRRKRNNPRKKHQQQCSSAVRWQHCKSGVKNNVKWTINGNAAQPSARLGIFAQHYAIKAVARYTMQLHTEQWCATINQECSSINSTWKMPIKDVKHGMCCYISCPNRTSDHTANVAAAAKAQWKIL